MNPIPIMPDYPTEPSRLILYKPCQTPIGGELWLRHLRTIEILEEQAVKLGLPIVSLELAILRAKHVAAQLGCELDDVHS
jgi:hypothetical protein